MAIKIATGDYLITEALEYLQRLGVPARVIRTLNVNTTFGEPIRLELVIYVEAEPQLVACALGGHDEHEHDGYCLKAGGVCSPEAQGWAD